MLLSTALQIMLLQQPLLNLNVPGKFPPTTGRAILAVLLEIEEPPCHSAFCNSHREGNTSACY